MLFSADRYLAFVPLLTHARKPIYRLLSPSKASNPFPEILQQLFNIKNNVSIQALSSYDILPITINQCCMPNCDYDLHTEKFIIIMLYYT